VSRRSILEILKVITALLNKRDRVAETREEYEDIDIKLRTQILALWQTRMLRHTKPSVLDEVNNVLSFFEATFFDAVPKLYTAVERAGGEGVDNLPAFLQIGSWIGGDRDGNPFVDANVLTEALSYHAERAFRFYINEVQQLRYELCLTKQPDEVTPELMKLVEASPDISAHTAWMSRIG
jgi:phosphoenolpyruvate carboxylase